MKYKLAGRSILVNSFAFEKIEDEDIQTVLEKCSDNEEMIKLLRLIKSNRNLEHSYNEKMDYYQDIIGRILGFAKHEYPEEYRDLFLAFVVMGYAQSDEDIFLLVKSQAENFADSTESMTDEIWFMYQSLNYEILNACSVDTMLENSDTLEYAKKLINELKLGQKRYEELYAAYQK